MNKMFWKKKNILITGYEGFLGSNLTRALLGSGAKIVGLDIKVHRKETILAYEDYVKMTVVKGSVTDYGLLSDILKRYNINIIFHLAAEAIVGESWKAPIKTFKTNITGTWNVLESSRQERAIEAIIVASSDKAYGAHKKLPYREDTPLQGSHPYDVSKSCLDLIAHAYAHTYGLPVAITRCGNIYGPGEFNFSRIVPDSIRCALTGKTLFIRSNGKFTRDYIFVDDIVDGYIFLAERLQALNLIGEAFNFSNEKPLSVMELVKEIFRIAHSKPNYRILNEAKYEIKDQYLSSKKARKIIGWKPRYSLEKGLEKTIKWYLSNLKGSRRHL